MIKKAPGYPGAFICEIGGLEMEQEKRKMCIYCGRWYPADQVKPIPEDDQKGNEYCIHHWEEVRREIKNLPWNRNKF